MLILFILGLLLGSAAVVFTLQNVGMITVTFFAWQIEGSLAAVLAVVFLTGIVIALLFVIPELVRNHFRVKALKKENKELGDELHKQKELTAFAKKVPPTTEEISRIEHGAVNTQ